MFWGQTWLTKQKLFGEHRELFLISLAVPSCTQAVHKQNKEEPELFTNSTLPELLDLAVKALYDITG